MRKITGYIGAMIIVFALMGSILAGYALNINGTTAVINEYETVTDVSGLYNHSEQKNYIDYNPANNYIGYSKQYLYDNPSGFGTLKNITSGTITLNTDGTTAYNGKTYGPVSGSQINVMFICDKFFIIRNSNNNTLYDRGMTGNGVTITSPITITINGTTTTGNVNGTNYSYTTTFNLMYYTGVDYDYIMHDGRGLNYTNSIKGYANNLNQLYTIGYQQSISGGTTTTVMTISKGQTLTRFMGESASNVGWQNWQGFNYNYNTLIDNGVYYDELNFNLTRTANGTTWNWAPYVIFYPRTIYSTETTGINYTESNRVNNYPFEYDYNQYTTTQNETVNLMALSAANQFTYNDGWLISTGSRDIIETNGARSSYWAGGNFRIKTDVTEYKITDILSTLTIPAGTTSILIDIPINAFEYPIAHVPLNTSYFPYSYMDVYGNFVYNPELVTINPYSDYYPDVIIGDMANYCIYYPDTGLVDIFNKYSNVKIATSSANVAVVRFVKNTTTTGVYDYNYTGYYDEGAPFNGTSSVSFTLANRGTAQLNLTYSINGAITNTHYMDITKGISIKAGNVNNITWDNQYENGVIDLLFRAESTTETYHNEFTISNNNVSVDYDGGRFSVTLNGGDPIDIGTWRNIVLSIDLINGKLYAIPVKTFNSYTNVVLTNTSVTIGDLVSGQTTTISWIPTNKSFRFNVYSTSVFMDTYGVIMVNPSLNISDYFTDLNGFYRLKLTNFATIGSSMTVNGETLNVTGNTITYNNKSLIIKDMEITYADGKVTIGDNHTDIDLGDITTTNISMTGAWYFLTELERGYTTQKLVYDWDWGTFIFDNTQFCVFYLGFMAAALIVARRYCSLSITDYVVLGISIIIALGVQVIA